MKNKFFLPIFLLFAVNNLQYAAEVVKTITAKEFSDLVGINQLKKKLELLEAKVQGTPRENEIIASLKASIAEYDKKIQDKLSELKKDEVKNAEKIKILAGQTSEKVTDELVEEAKKGLSITSQACYYTWHKKRLATIIGLGALIGATVYGMYNYFFTSADEDDQEDDGDDIE